jgi:hypothetical protein
MNGVDRLNDTLAVRALSEVTQRWYAERGLQALAVLRETESYAHKQNLYIPNWAIESGDQGIVTAESGKACRAALKALINDDDPQIRSWTRSAVERANQTQVQALDPVSLAVGGLVLGGLILAARVKKIGPEGVEFYEGIPEELAKILGAGANFFQRFSGL